MNSYRPRTPRAAFGLAAVAMSAITMATMVVLPAELEAADYAQGSDAIATGAAVESFVARGYLDAYDEMVREDEAERAALAPPAPCVHSPEAGVPPHSRS